MVAATADNYQTMENGFRRGEYTAQQLLGIYCKQLYNKFGAYEEVARVTKLDRRTVKKYIESV